MNFKAAIMQNNQPNKRDFSEDDRYFRARKRVKEMQGFYRHVILYSLVVIMLFVLVYGGFEERGGIFQFLKYLDFETPFWSILWFWFPIIIWGLVVVVQGLFVFGFGSRWEDRKIKELMNKEEF